jgi:hypothetical protein
MLKNYEKITKLQCCGSGMFIPDPDFYPPRATKALKNMGWGSGIRKTYLGSRISDPGTKKASDPGRGVPRILPGGMHIFG